jgi:hypothetical protein|eukprot:COSAG02_NODE_2589_length_8471_cov_113.759556_5_plen_185_part_00
MNALWIEQAHQNMTTLCENFACTFHEAGGGSQNHIMLGGWDAWLHSSIAGLDAVVNGSVYGWKELVVRVSPGVIPELKAVSSERQTPFGQVSFAWSYSNAKFTQELKLPVGTTATVHAPDSVEGRRLHSIVHVESSGTRTTLWSNGGPSDSERPAGVVTSQNGIDAVEVTVGSGSYRLESEYRF